ncbi:MAG: flippase-like domain-containing protein [Lentisphaerae bacterium]|nr:flippase-like domain-containing protein [Lentisphaerota bacterium]
MLKNPYLRAAIGAVMLGLFAYLGRRCFGQIHLLREAAIGWVLLNAALFLVTRYVNGEVMRVSLRQVGHRLGHGEAFMLNLIMGYTNLILPRAGLSAPIAYLRLRHGVSYAQFTALAMPMVLLQFVVQGLLGLGACLWAVTQGETTWARQSALVGLFALVALGAIGMMCIHIPVPDRWQGRLAGFLRRVNAAWFILRENPRFVLHILLLQFVVAWLRAWRMQTAFLAVGMSIGLAPVLISSLCAQLALVVSLTPGALGFREAAIVYAAARYTGDPELAFNASVLDRLVMTLLLVVVAQVGLVWLVRPALREAAAATPSEDPAPPAERA